MFSTCWKTRDTKTWTRHVDRRRRGHKKKTARSSDERTLNAECSSMNDCSWTLFTNKVSPTSFLLFIVMNKLFIIRSFEKMFMNNFHKYRFDRSFMFEHCQKNGFGRSLFILRSPMKRSSEVWTFPLSFFNLYVISFSLYVRSKVKCYKIAKNNQEHIK